MRQWTAAAGSDAAAAGSDAATAGSDAADAGDEAANTDEEAADGSEPAAAPKEEDAEVANARRRRRRPVGRRGSGRNTPEIFRSDSKSSALLESAETVQRPRCRPTERSDSPPQRQREKRSDVRFPARMFVSFFLFLLSIGW